MVGHRDVQAVPVGRDFRPVLQIVSDENHAFFPGLFIQAFPLPVGSDIPVQNEDPPGRVFIQQMEGGRKGMGTAKPGTIGTFRLARPHALDEDRGLGRFQFRGPVHQLLIQFQSGQDAGVLSMEILPGFVFLCAAGNHGHTMFHGPLLAVGFDGRPEVAHKTVHRRELGPQMAGDPLIGQHRIDQDAQLFLNVFALGCGQQMVGLAAQALVPFNQMNAVALTGKRLGRRHPGNAPAHNQGVLIDGKLLFFQRRLQSHPGHGHAHQVPGLQRGLGRLVAVHPRILVADIDHFEKIFVQPGIDQGFLKQRFVSPGGAGGHHNAVQVLFPNDPGDGVLGILAA